MGERRKTICWDKYWEKNFGFGGEGFKLYLKRCSAPSLLLSSSPLVLAIPSVREWEGKGLTAGSGPGCNSHHLHTEKWLHSGLLHRELHGLFFAEVDNGYVAKKWWFKTNTTKTPSSTVDVSWNTGSTNKILASLCLFKITP